MKITFEELAKIIFEDIKSKMENNSGLAIFAKERAKFEGWLKVELCGSLSEYFSTVTSENDRIDVIPEKDSIDVTFDDWAIELKIINTNYRYENIKNKICPITNNINGVIDDIEKLKSTNYTNKTVLFVAFPAPHDYKKWEDKYLNEISKQLKDSKYEEFKFKNKIPGVIYFGLIK